MFNQNKIWAGLLFGLLLPAVGSVLIFQIFKFLAVLGGASGEGFTPNFRERTSVVIAIALNMIPMNIYRKRRWELSMRGVMIATVLLAFVWILHYSLHVF